MEYDADTDDMVFAKRWDLPNDNNSVCLMREEEGRVYLLDKDMGDLGWLSQQTGGEFLIYDFNRTAGESYELLSGQWYWNMEPRDVCYTPCDILSTGTVELAGEECAVQNVSCEIPGKEYFSIIEGIGFTEHGVLPFLYYDMTTGMYSAACDLNRVYNADGEVIYRGLDIDPETVSVDAVAALPSAAIRYDGVTLTATGRDGKRISLTLLDVSGKIMSRVLGSGTLSSSTAGLSSGVYVAVAESDGMAVARRKFTVR